MDEDLFMVSVLSDMTDKELEAFCIGLDSEIEAENHQEKRTVVCQ